MAYTFVSALLLYNLPLLDATLKLVGKSTFQETVYVKFPVVVADTVTSVWAVAPLEPVQPVNV